MRSWCGPDIWAELGLSWEVGGGTGLLQGRGRESFGGKWELVVMGGSDRILRGPLLYVTATLNHWLERQDNSFRVIWPGTQSSAMCMCVVCHVHKCGQPWALLCVTPPCLGVASSDMEGHLHLPGTESSLYGLTRPSSTVEGHPRLFSVAKIRLFIYECSE